MITVSKSQLKTNMLKIFRDVEKSGEEIVVTDNNRPVLRIVPFDKGKTVEDVFGHVQGKVVYKEDINTPTIEEWGNLP